MLLYLVVSCLPATSPVILLFYCICVTNVYHLLVEYFYSFFVSSFTVYCGCVLCMRLFVYELLLDSK